VNNKEFLFSYFLKRKIYKILLNFEIYLNEILNRTIKNVTMFVLWIYFYGCNNTNIQKRARIYIRIFLNEKVTISRKIIISLAFEIVYE
jgi:hypothetical protein